MDFVRLPDVYAVAADTGDGVIFGFKLFRQQPAVLPGAANDYGLHIIVKTMRP
jgi:hypothetical protein